MPMRLKRLIETDGDSFDRTGKQATSARPFTELVADPVKPLQVIVDNVGTARRVSKSGRQKHAKKVRNMMRVKRAVFACCPHLFVLAAQQC